MTDLADTRKSIRTDENAITPRYIRYTTAQYWVGEECKNVANDEEDAILRWFCQLC